MQQLVNYTPQGYNLRQMFGRLAPLHVANPTVPHVLQAGLKILPQYKTAGVHYTVAVEAFSDALNAAYSSKYTTPAQRRACNAIFRANFTTPARAAKVLTRVIARLGM